MKKEAIEDSLGKPMITPPTSGEYENRSEEDEEDDENGELEDDEYEDEYDEDEGYEEDEADEEDEESEEDEEFEADKLMRIEGIRPAQIIVEGSPIEFKSTSSGKTYILKRNGNQFECSCPAWRNQRGNPNIARTCKHLREALGDIYERLRVQQTRESDYYFLGPPGKRRSLWFDGNVPTKLVKTSVDPFLVMLARSWEPAKQDVSGWWISEKLDGVRAVWDPKARAFKSRRGNAYYAPESYMEGLPLDATLDGELFCGRGQFRRTVSIVRADESRRWRRVKYCVFDVPSLGSQPYEQRLEWLERWHDRQRKALKSRVILVEQIRCIDNNHVLEELARMKELGGEGLMLRKPQSEYVFGRSEKLLKVKTFHDAEALVIAHVRSRQGAQKIVRALRCRMENGNIFKVRSGLSDALKKDPPPVGSIITYQYQELRESGAPRYPTFLRVRYDVSEPKDFRQVDTKRSRAKPPI